MEIKDTVKSLEAAWTGVWARRRPRRRCGPRGGRAASGGHWICWQQGPGRGERGKGLRGNIMQNGDQPTHVLRTLSPVSRLVGEKLVLGRKAPGSASVSFWKSSVCFFLLSFGGHCILFRTPCVIHKRGMKFKEKDGSKRFAVTERKV